MFRYVVSVLVSACLLASGAACTTTRVMANPDANAVVEKVAVGDYVNISAKNGKRYAVEVTEVGGSYLRGTDPETGKHYRFPYAQIQAMSYDTIHGGKTAAVAGATAGTALYVYVVLGILAAFAAIGDSFGESWNGGGGGGC